MAKYLGIVSYTSQGVQGLLKDGGSKRRDVAAQAIESLGGTLDAYYYAFGDVDVYVIIDVPDHVSAATISLAVSATGAAGCKIVVLLTPEEIDAATQKVIEYTAPGQ